MTDYKTVLWDATGPHWLDPSNGKKTYIAPAIAAQTTSDPKLVQWGQQNLQAPSGGLVHGRGQWNTDTGKWEQHLAGGNLLSLGIGGLLAAPIVAGAVGAGGAGSVAFSGPLEGTVGAGTVGAGTVGGGITAAAPSLASRLLTSPSMWGTIASTVGGIYSAKQQINANNDAARLSADATKYASDATTKASEAAEKFLREQAQYGYTASEAANKANYGQYLAREHRLASIGDLLGAGPRETPDYVPQPDPHFTGGGSATTPSVGQSLSGAPPNVVDGSAASISAYFKSRGVSDSETPYWVQKWAEFGAKDPAYFNQRLAQADIFGGNKAASPAAQRLAYQPYVGSSVGSLLSRYQAPPLPPTLAQRGY